MLISSFIHIYTDVLCNYIHSYYLNYFSFHFFPYSFICQIIELFYSASLCERSARGVFEGTDDDLSLPDLSQIQQRKIPLTHKETGEQIKQTDVNTSPYTDKKKRYRHINR